jgi:hypothetical protein
LTPLPLAGILLANRLPLCCGDGIRRWIDGCHFFSLPITIAITISSSDDAAVQRALTEAYESKSLRGSSSGCVRCVPVHLFFPFSLFRFQ